MTPTLWGPRGCPEGCTSEQTILWSWHEAGGSGRDGWGLPITALVRRPLATLAWTLSLFLGEGRNRRTVAAVTNRHKSAQLSRAEFSTWVSLG